MGKGRWWTLAVALAALLALVAGRSLLGTDPSPDAAESPTTQFISPVITRYHQGKRQWSLRFDRVVESRDQGDVYLLERVSEGVWYEDGEPGLRFEAERGRWNQATGDLELTGFVRFEGSEGLRFEAPSVLWSAGTGKLVAQEPVDVELRGQRLRADRLVADLEADQVTLDGNVEWVGDDGARARGTRAILYQDRGRIELFGDPVELEFPAG